MRKMDLTEELDDIILHNTDEEKELEDKEKEKEKADNEKAKELKKRKDDADKDINDAEADKLDLKDGSGKKIKGLVEKLHLDEDAAERSAEKLTFLLDDLGIDSRDILEHISTWMSSDDLERCLDDYISDNDLEDEVSFLNDDFPSDRPLDENVPRSLAKAYKDSYSARKTKKFGDDTDLYNSDYQPIDVNDPAQLELVKKVYKEDPTKIRLMIGGKYVNFRDNGKPDLNNRIHYVSDDKAYIRSTGRKIRDTRRMPLSHLVKIADEVYIANEVEKDQNLLAKRAENPESPNFRGELIRSTAGGYDMRGYWKPGNTKQDIKRYETYIIQYRNDLDELEGKHRDGAIDDETYERRKNDIVSDIKYYQRKIYDYKSSDRDYRSLVRYDDSNRKLQEPFRKFKELRYNLNNLEHSLDRSREKVQRIKDNGSPETAVTRENYERYLRELKDIQKKIKLMEIKLEGSDEEDAEALANAEGELQSLIDKKAEADKEYNKLFRRDK